MMQQTPHATHEERMKVADQSVKEGFAHDPRKSFLYREGFVWLHSLPGLHMEPLPRDKLGETGPKDAPKHVASPPRTFQEMSEEIKQTTEEAIKQVDLLTDEQLDEWVKNNSEKIIAALPPDFQSDAKEHGLDSLGPEVLRELLHKGISQNHFDNIIRAKEHYEIESAVHVVVDHKKGTADFSFVEEESKLKSDDFSEISSSKLTLIDKSGNEETFSSGSAASSIDSNFVDQSDPHHNI
uniref:Uncharacterized protein n=1 Tax=Halamphora calidilacuna TaxID=2133758 RepID=A0A2R4A3P5_9STRA|nr:hypothetical protein [Halamphora calidilacuna]